MTFELSDYQKKICCDIYCSAMECDDLGLISGCELDSLEDIINDGIDAFLHNRKRYFQSQLEMYNFKLLNYLPKQRELF